MVVQPLRQQSKYSVWWRWPSPIAGEAMSWRGVQRPSPRGVEIGEAGSILAPELSEWSASLMFDRVTLSIEL
jgi:hypothetical protein